MTNRVSQRPPDAAAFDRSGDSAETPESAKSTAPRARQRLGLKQVSAQRELSALPARQ
ncbi:hypothetical protein [Trinickia violacea]|uniref:hypothetical protein n=1 Tax=Trinickia violacea TaxID=2571746 RepID=UPI0015860B8E|nr:hypothetical protein [Trinickia violacea]